MGLVRRCNRLFSSSVLSVIFIGIYLLPRFALFLVFNVYLCTRFLKRGKEVQGLYSIGLLIISNIFMTLAWYGHLKLQEMKVISNWPLYGVILLSWGIALFEYCCQVPANRLGFRENGGPFSLMQLKVIQEVITLIIFTVFSVVFFKGESLHWNHIAAFGCLVLAVYFVFMK